MEKSLYNLRMELWHESFKDWINNDLFTFPWFFNIALLALFYVIWIKIVDKKRLQGLLLFGALLAVASVLVDTIAVTIGLWEYNVSIFPLSPAPFPFDFTIIPILFMLALQYTTSWRNYLIGSIIASSIFSFIIEPLYVWLGIKTLHKFNYLYLFIIVLVVTTAINAIFKWIVKITLKHSGNVSEASKIKSKPQK
jgi:hypothetical protein